MLGQNEQRGHILCLGGPMKTERREHGTQSKTGGEGIGRANEEYGRGGVAPHEARGRGGG